MVKLDCISGGSKYAGKLTPEGISDVNADRWFAAVQFVSTTELSRGCTGAWTELAKKLLFIPCPCRRLLTTLPSSWLAVGSPRGPGEQDSELCRSTDSEVDRVD